jgi:hypothetical protein
MRSVAQQVGRRDGALAATEEVVKQHRRSAQDNPRHLLAPPRHIADQPRHLAAWRGSAGGGAGRHRGSCRAAPPIGQAQPPPPTCPTARLASPTKVNNTTAARASTSPASPTPHRPCVPSTRPTRKWDSSATIGGANPNLPVGAELAIHGGELRNRWTVTVGHDRRSWRYDCCT